MAQTGVLVTLLMCGLAVPAHSQAGGNMTNKVAVDLSETAEPAKLNSTPLPFVLGFIFLTACAVVVLVWAVLGKHIPRFSDDEEEDEEEEEEEEDLLEEDPDAPK